MKEGAMKTKATTWEKVAEMGRRGRDMEGRLIKPETPEAAKVRREAMEAMTRNQWAKDGAA